MRMIFEHLFKNNYYLNNKNKIIIGIYLKTIHKKLSAYRGNFGIR